MGDTEFESVTSTLSTSEGIDENSVKRGADHDVGERLHQCLHQIAGNDQPSVASVVLDAIVETLGNDAAVRVLEALQRQTEAVTERE